MVCYKAVKYHGAGKWRKFDFACLRNNWKVYIYGAGLWGMRTYCLMRYNGIDVEQFIVSDFGRNSSTLLGLKVEKADELDIATERVYVVMAFFDQSKYEIAEKMYHNFCMNIVVIEGLEHEKWLDGLIPKKYYPEALAVWYYSSTGYRLDLSSPKTFNEKIQWLKLFDSTPMKTQLADKLLVRDWVKNKIGDKYIIPLLGVWSCFDDIDFDSLPEQFVLKCTHGCGYNLIVKDKKKLSYAKEKSKFDRWLRTNFAFENGFELHYDGIPRRIIAERYLQDDFTADLRDYKVFTFSGIAKLVQVDIDRFGVHKRNLYTPKWERIDGQIGYPCAPDVVINKPKQLKTMLSLAEILGKDFAHVRVDFYIVHEKIYFGEMTFTHGGGQEKFEPNELNLQMGNWIHLSEVSKNDQ